MKKQSIKTAIIVPTLAVLSAGILLMSAVAGILSMNSADDLTRRLIETTVGEYANEFEGLCGGIYETLSAITPIAAKYIDPVYAAGIDDPREELTDILSRVLLSDDALLAIWTCWEPNTFDGKDSSYANTAFYDATGRFVPYLYREGSGYAVEALADYDDPVAGEYYLAARDSGKPYMTDPYLYKVGGVETPICSLALPILQNGRTVGVVGADIDLQDFMTLMNGSSILEDGYLFTLSPGGLLASHPKKEYQMTDYRVTWLGAHSAQINSVLTKGGGFSLEEYSSVLGTEIHFLCESIKIGDTERYWLLCGVVPSRTVNASSTALLWTIVAIGAALVAVVGLTVFYLFQKRLQAMPRLSAAAEQIAAGDIELADLDKGTERTKNEITLLERAFSRMAEGIREQGEVLTRIAGGDYSMEIRPRSEKDVINRAIGGLLATTNKVLGQINASAGQVSIGSKHVADNSQSLAKGAAEQAASMEQLGASVNEIAEKTAQNAAIAREAARLSGEIKEKAETGSGHMAQMMQAVGEIMNASSQIEKVINAIDNIAFQTNILALNAAVEAARAGQHGKGFAVVAEEVRDLATKSASSASDTSAMIENAKEKASLGLAIAEETARSLEEIISGVNRNAGIVAQIEQAAEEQALAIAQINAGIGQVSQVIQQNSAGAEESAAASEEMSGQSELLTRLTAQFILR